VRVCLCASTAVSVSVSVCSLSGFACVRAKREREKTKRTAKPPANREENGQRTSKSVQEWRSTPAEQAAIAEHSNPATVAGLQHTATHGNTLQHTETHTEIFSPLPAQKINFGANVFSLPS